ncbi:MAG: AbrB family transcriptional regulator [Xanthobacteraceae bacterium]
MSRSSRTVYSRVSVKSQTVIPRAIRDLLGLKPGDLLRYRESESGVLIDKAPAEETDDPFATFTEWAGEPDEEAYADL